MVANAQRRDARRSSPPCFTPLRSVSQPRSLTSAALARSALVRTLITGGAGFIGSHLCDRFLAEGHEVVAVDNFITGTPENIAHLLGNPKFKLIGHDISHPLKVHGQARQRPALRQPGQPGRLPRTPDPDAQGRLARHAQHARHRQGPRGPLPARQHERGLRRPARTPADGELLGERQPGRRPRRVRRGQAVRRVDDDGLPPRPRA